MAAVGRVPGFPRWTNVTAHVAGPTSWSADSGVAFTVEIRLTRRARVWALWRTITGRRFPDASAHG